MIDRRQLRVLLVAYLRQSLRGRVGQAFAPRGRRWGLVILLVMYASIGCIVGVFGADRTDAFTFALVLHTTTLMLVGLSISAESGDVLFDQAEQDVLGHRPVPPGTLLAAKAGSLVAFSFLLALALNLPPLVLALRVSGPWFPLAHLLAVALLAVFCAATVICGYAILARVVRRERFDSVAAWSQVVLSVAFLAVSQALPRLMDRLVALRLEVAPSFVLFPPAWFAALEALMAGAPPTAATLAFAALAPLATVGLGYAAIVRLAPHYVDAVVALGVTPAAPRAASPVARRRHGPLLGRWLRDPVERASFDLAAVYLRRDREIRRRLYPSVASFALLPLLWFVSLRTGPVLLVPLVSVCMLGMLPAVALEALRMSGHHAAASIFLVAPLDRADALFHGVRKAAISYLLAPGVALTLALSAVVAPIGLALVPAGLIALPSFSLLPGLLGQYVPLAQPPARGQQTVANTLLVLISTLVLGVLVLATWVAWEIGLLLPLLAVEAVIAVSAQRGLTRRIARRPLQWHA